MLCMLGWLRVCASPRPLPVPLVCGEGSRDGAEAGGSPGPAAASAASNAHLEPRSKRWGGLGLPSPWPGEIQAGAASELRL